MSIRFDDAPQEQNPQQGTTAKIKCVVRANPVAFVEWIKDEETISSGGRCVDSVDVRQFVVDAAHVFKSDDGTNSTHWYCIYLIMFLGKLLFQLHRYMWTVVYASDTSPGYQLKLENRKSYTRKLLQSYLTHTLTHHLAA